MLDASAILLTNKIAVVTGGGRGLGEAIALNMAAFGADVAVLDIDEPAARRTAERVREVGRRSLALRADVGVREDVDAALDRTRRELGEIDILVNNAADLTDPRPALTISDDRFDHFVRSSLGSVWLCSTTVARRWIELDRPGVIVNLATTEAIRGCPNWSAYSAAKAGVINLTKTLSSEWGPHGIRLNAIAPDYTPSPGTAFAGRRFNTEDPGSLVFRAGSPAGGEERWRGLRRSSRCGATARPTTPRRWRSSWRRTCPRGSPARPSSSTAARWRARASRVRCPCRCSWTWKNRLDRGGTGRGCRRVTTGGRRLPRCAHGDWRRRDKHRC